MKMGSKIFLLTFFSFILVGCQSGGSETNSTVAVPNANSAVNVSQTNSYVASNGETMQPAFNGEVKEVANNDTVQTNVNTTAANSSAEKVESISTGMPAADNSTYTAEMNESGKPVETRTFKSHPILLKVEKITLSSRDYVFKVYLKDGKVVETKSDELKQFRYIAPENILDAIDKLPKATPDPNDPTRDGKKKQTIMQQPNQ
jgi:hypothetical protein